MAEFLPKYSGLTFAGICESKIEIAREADSAFVAPIVANTHTGVVVLLSLTEWLEVFCVEGSLKFSEEEIQVEGGSAWSAVLTGRISKDTPERLMNIVKASRGGWLIKFTDNNGTQRLMGFTKKPVTIQVTRELGGKLGDKNGYSFTANIVMKKPVPAYPF